MTALFGEKVKLGQANGEEVELRAFGDEFYARYETLDGYTAVYDPASGLFSYARPEDGELVSTGVPVSDAPPPGLAKHLEEAPEIRYRKAMARQAAMMPPEDPGSHRS